MFSVSNFMKALIANSVPMTQSLNATAQTTRDPQPVVEAIVTQTISPGRKGQVKFQGSWWTARCNDEITLVRGDIVQVIKRQDLTLYIAPIVRFTDFCNL